MGCSASRSANFISHHQNPTSNSSSSFSSSQLQSPSDPSSTPVSRTMSLPTPLVHHPPLRKGDSNHFVALTSTTYGSLVIVDSPNPSFDGQDLANSFAIRKAQDFASSEDPLSPDSVINTWELMEGLDEDEDEEFNYHLVAPPAPAPKLSDAITESYEIVEHPVSKPLWQHLSDESKPDSDMLFQHPDPWLSRQQECKKPNEMPKSLEMESCDLRRHISNESKTESNISSRHPISTSLSSRQRCQKLNQMPKPLEIECCDLLGAEDRIVLYYTSLRGIRKTYEDCCSVRVILRGFRVSVDEKDISMDRSYRAELQEALKGKGFSLPRLFIRGKCIGGAEEIKQMNETGELAKVLEGFPVMDLGCACEICGDARFVPCVNCNGSRKVYREEEGTLIKCPYCNENGLVRCSGCCP